MDCLGNRWLKRQYILNPNVFHFFLSLSSHRGILLIELILRTDFKNKFSQMSFSNKALFRIGTSWRKDIAVVAISSIYPLACFLIHWCSQQLAYFPHQLLFQHAAFTPHFPRCYLTTFPGFSVSFSLFLITTIPVYYSSPYLIFTVSSISPY